MIFDFRIYAPHRLSHGTDSAAARLTDAGGQGALCPLSMMSTGWK